MRKWLLLAGLLLPLLWFASGWVMNGRAIHSGSSWQIPVEGYDPRDLLRGQYIRFRYGWVVRGSAAACSRQGCDLCLSNTGSGVEAAIVPVGTQCRNRVDVLKSGIRFSHGFRTGPQFSSRIFVSESSAPQLERELAKGGATVETRLTSDGRLVNVRLIGTSGSRD